MGLKSHLTSWTKLSRATRPWLECGILNGLFTSYGSVMLSRWASIHDGMVVRSERSVL